MKIVFSEEAVLDLREIADYLLIKANEGVLDRLVSEIDRIVDLLADNPEAGFRVKELVDDKIRYFPAGKFKKYNIYYETEGNKLVVNRILHGKRDIPRILE